MRERCCLCERVFSVGHTYDLTADERDLLGPDAPAALSYCEACLKVAQNLQQGAWLLRGYFEQALRAQDVPDAKKRADEFHAKLVQAATSKLH